MAGGDWGEEEEVIIINYHVSLEPRPQEGQFLVHDRGEHDGADVELEQEAELEEVRKQYSE